ncbi:MAG: hypothetical protein AB7Q69_15880, partial [Gemmatimonadales bacterium]
YTFEDLGRPDRDRCIGVLPAAGGTISRTICVRTPGTEDSTDALAQAAPGPNGQLLLLRASSGVNQISPVTAGLVLATMTDPLQGLQVQHYPFLTPGGHQAGGIGEVQWLDATHALFLAQAVNYPAVCPGCRQRDTLAVGVEVLYADLSGPAPVIANVPNTDEVSSIAAGTTGDDFYYTINGDTRVYRRVLSTGATSIVHDFGAQGIARDVSLRGNRMLAVVGGVITYSVDPTLGPVQRDSGGIVVDVDLTNGSSSPIAVPNVFFRNPALAPDGRHAVAQGYPYTILICGMTCRDTAVSRSSDLWLFDLP